MIKLRNIVKRGKFTGSVMTPHLHKDKHFVVSQTRFEKDYIRVREESDLLAWVEKGYSVRMSVADTDNARPASLIAPISIETYTG